MKINKLPFYYFYFAIIFSIGLFANQPIFAVTWQDLWARPDEQAAKLLQEGKAKQAAKKFENDNWRGVANYRAGQYQQAVTDFSQQDNATALYNKGNALAHTGQYQAAIDTYNQSLKLNPNNKDAIYNRDLLKKLLQQQKKRQQSSNGDKNQENNKQRQANKSKQNQQQKQQQKQQQNQQQNQQQAQNDQKKQQQQTAPQQSSQQQDASNKQQPVNTKPQTGQQKQQHPTQNGQQQAQNQQQMEQQQARKQWLRRIPDDPGGLLRQKFLRDYMRRQNNNYNR